MARLGHAGASATCPQVPPRSSDTAGQLAVNFTLPNMGTYFRLLKHLGTTKEVLGFIIDFLDFNLDFLGFPILLLGFPRISIRILSGF